MKPNTDARWEMEVGGRLLVIEIAPSKPGARHGVWPAPFDLFMSEARAVQRRMQCRYSGGEVLGYDFDRMVVDFTMFNQGKAVRCLISTAAMDNLEGRMTLKPTLK